MKLRLKKLLSVILAVMMLASLVSIPVSAAEYRVAVNGASNSYKSGRYYQHYLKVPITGVNRQDLLAIALSQLGYQESNLPSAGDNVNYPGNYDFSGLNGGSGNCTEYNYSQGDWALGYGGSDYPWCASFVSWCLYQSRCTDVASNSYIGRKYNNSPSGKNPRDYMWKEYSCSAWTSVLSAAGCFQKSKYRGGNYIPQSGDLIFFISSGQTSSGHIGIVVYSDGSTVYTVEGNTSPGNGIVVANGGGVYFKSYSLSSSYLYGYGTMPYKNNSLPSVDYSGANPTAGLYMTLSYKYLYADAACTQRAKYGDGVYVDIPKYHMFEATGITADKTAAIVNYDGVQGYVSLNSTDKVLQISAEVNTELSNAKAELLQAIQKAQAVNFQNYDEGTLYNLRNSYEYGVSVYNDSSATEETVVTATNNIKKLLASTGTNNPMGVRLTGMNEKIQTGDCHLFTSKLANSANGNGWKATVSNANIAFTLNVVVGWDDAVSGWVVKSKSQGNGVDTADIEMTFGELLIAAHIEPDIPESVTAFNNLNRCEVGDVVKFYGVTITDDVHYASIASYLTYERVGDPNIVYGKDYTISGNGQPAGDYTANLTDGQYSLDFNVLNTWYGFNNDVATGKVTNTVNGIGSVTFDLGKSYNISGVRVHIGEHWDWGVVTPFEIYLEYSNDGKNYTKYPKSFPLTKTEEHEWGTSWTELKDIEGVNASYVRISTRVCGSWFFLNEVQVFGVEGQATHTHNHNAVVTKPTCTEKGFTTYTCNCGNTYVSDYVDPSHTAGEWVIETEAEYGAEGLRCKYCVSCGTLVESEAIPALTILRGDINGDGEIKPTDYFMLKQYILGLIDVNKLPSAHKQLADYNGDGKVNVADYMKLKSDILNGKV